MQHATLKIVESIFRRKIQEEFLACIFDKPENTNAVVVFKTLKEFVVRFSYPENNKFTAKAEYKIDDDHKFVIESVSGNGTGAITLVARLEGRM